MPGVDQLFLLVFSFPRNYKQSTVPLSQLLHKTSLLPSALVDEGNAHTYTKHRICIGVSLVAFEPLFDCLTCSQNASHLPHGVGLMSVPLL